MTNVDWKKGGQGRGCPVSLRNENFRLGTCCRTVRSNVKNPPKLDSKIREMACNSLTNYEYEEHAMQWPETEGMYMNLLKLACEKLWKHFGRTYFGGVLDRWNHSVSVVPYPSLNGDCFGYEVFPFPFHIVPFGPSFKHLHVKGKMGIFWSSTFSSSTKPKCTRFAALLMYYFGSNFVPFFYALLLHMENTKYSTWTDIYITLFNFN